MENKYTKLIDAEKIKQENANKLNQKPDQPRTLEKPIVPPNSSKVDSKDKELVSQLSAYQSPKEFMTRDDGQVNEPFVSGQTSSRWGTSGCLIASWTQRNLTIRL